MCVPHSTAAPFVIWHDACVTFDLIQLMDANCLYVFAIRRRKSRLPGITAAPPAPPSIAALQLGEL